MPLGAGSGKLQPWRPPSSGSRTPGPWEPCGCRAGSGGLPASPVTTSVCGHSQGTARFLAVLGSLRPWTLLGLLTIGAASVYSGGGEPRSVALCSAGPQNPGLGGHPGIRSRGNGALTLPGVGKKWSGGRGTKWDMVTVCTASSKCLPPHLPIPTSPVCPGTGWVHC